MAAAVTEKIMSPSPPPSQHMHLSPSTSRRGLDAAFDTDALDRRPSLDLSSSSSPSPSRLSDAQNQLFVRSEEYRQLFRLPPVEVLVQDFNCALQESFLLQGHMYLFGHYICFYSNLFGFETKKIIHFHEITLVRRAKAAAIFPTAIEIVAGEKKYFFTSFLSRDEAFKLINDGWLQHNGAAKESTDLEPKSDLNSQDSGIPEGTDSFRQATEGVESIERNKDDTVQEDSKPSANGEFEIVSKPLGLQGNVEEEAVIAQSTDCSSSGRSSALKQEDSDAPRVPECFTLVAEAKFLVTVEKFFELFISDDGVAFQESFRRKCGDKDFKCTQWRPHEELGHSRNWSFQHPIKFYLGAKFGGCHEVQNYRFYRNSHLVIETSQEVSDVPFADYFRVQGFWDVETNRDEPVGGCCLKVYVNVAFSKKTMFRGKIVQSTVDECRDVYAIWIALAHELLKQKKLEKEEAGGYAANVVTSAQQKESSEHVEILDGASDEVRSQTLPLNLQAADSLRGSCSSTVSVTSLCRNLMLKCSSSFKSQSKFSILIVITIAVILLLMQMSILVLLGRPQHVHVIPQGDCTGSMYRLGDRGIDTLAFLDKQISHLKEEMVMVETLLGKMQQEHTLLKTKLKEFEHLRMHQKG
ncbi:protein VASCULAR ASSOCIATED DEATH 1, chloroplastic [Nicotiana tomentosiformis]|uniref:protein VASCULAR ASSOCIATED DEATH 1, chloroplastic n=1 Tax=Nicotiana tomentosiformis TaxID=4098 RepID=UPI00051AE4FC|nr:protein VASCULAR ASSOCIATED DEATH 1, chloroplastic [Nicotiana tomentosiformis]